MADGKIKIIQKLIPTKKSGIIEKKLGLQTYAQQTNNSNTVPSTSSASSSPSPESINQTNDKKTE